METQGPQDVGTPGGLDRRRLLKRAAVVSAGTAWVTPTIQSMVRPAFALGSAGPCDARLTGGGQIVSVTGLSVTYLGTTIESASFGVGQISCSGDGPVTIEVNAHLGGRPRDDVGWHFDRDLSVVCTKTGNPAPGPGTENCPNSFSGSAYDGSGNRLVFTFTDNGEPGTAVDFVKLEVYDATNTLLLSGTGLLSRGNLQVHPDQVTRDCSGC